ncbi:MAG: hypothetical protein IJC50_03780 [Clostridia bacterium]|nr:hypothetical protein [Clostridia bacterium]
MKFKNVNLPTEQLHSFDFAHRGLHDSGRGVAENSLDAFEAACEQGFGIELDVRLSADGTARVFHDATLKRAAGIKKLISKLTDCELDDIRIFGTQSRIPTLSEVLERIADRVPLLIELKSDKKSPDPTRAVHSLLKHYKGRYLIQSFDPRQLRLYRRLSPETPVGLLATGLRENGEKVSRIIDYVLKNLKVDFICRPDFISYDFSKRDRLSAIARRRLARGPEFSWTIRNLEDYAKAKELGCIPIFEGFLPKR